MSTEIPKKKLEDVSEEALSQLTDAQIKKELEEIAAEERRLDLEIKRAQVAEIRAKRQAALDAARAKNAALRNFLSQREAAQKICNHRKGGRNADAIMKGQGTDAYYAIVRHVLPNGKLFILCSRCGREWHPAHLDVVNGRVVDVPATPGYEEAVQWPSDNTASGSSLFIQERVQA